MQVKLGKNKVESAKHKEVPNLTNFTQAISQVVSSLQIKSQGKQQITGKNYQPASRPGSGGK